MNDPLIRKCAAPDCHVNFIMQHIDAKYCSLRCKDRAAKARRKLRDAMAPRQAPRQYHDERVVPIRQEPVKVNSTRTEELRKRVAAFEAEHGSKPLGEDFVRISEEVEALLNETEELSESEKALREVLSSSPGGIGQTPTETPE